MKTAKTLQRGIGVVSTGAPLPKDRSIKGQSNIESLGYSYLAPLEPYKYYGDYTHGFSNGSADERLESINAVLDNPACDVLLAARGATGSLDIISDFPFKKLGSERKLLIGQSDVTALLVQIPTRSNLFAIHGPTLGAEFADYHEKDYAKESVDTLIKLISDPTFKYSLSGTQIKVSEPKTGTLLAGNLTMFISLLGTPFEPDFSNAILVLEEVGEAPYRVERALTQLFLAGKFDSLSGLCFGRFSKCESSHGPSIEEVMMKFIANRLSSSTYPILSNLQVGHWGASMPIPIGCKAKIHEGVLHVLESPVQ